MSSKKKTQKSLFFCKFEETFKEQSFRNHSIYSSSRSKIEDKVRDEPADPDSQESWSNYCCRQSLARKSREISCFLPVLSRGCDFVRECFRKLQAWFILDRVLYVKTSIAPRGIRAKISLLTLLRERRNSDLAKDIFRQEQHLSPLCNCWFSVSRHSK